MNAALLANGCGSGADQVPHWGESNASLPRIELSQGFGKVAYATFENCICHLTKLHMQVYAVLPGI